MALFMNNYQAKARQFRRYPRLVPVEGINYCCLGLAGEGGEVANVMKKHFRDDGDVGDNVTDERRSLLLDEAGDALWYVAMLADELGYTLEQVAEDNIEKLEARYGTS